MAGAISGTSSTNLTASSTFNSDASADGFGYLGNSAAKEFKSGAGNITFTVGTNSGNNGATNGTKINFTGGDGTITGSGTGTNLTANFYANPNFSTGYFTAPLDSTDRTYRFIAGVSVTSSGNAPTNLKLKVTPSDASFSTTAIAITSMPSSGVDTDIKFEFTARGNSNGQTVRIELLDNYAGSSSAYTSSRFLETVPASTGVTGTVAVTTAADTANATGTTVVVGTAAVTTAADTSSASGTTVVLGTAAITTAADTSNATGTTAVVGSASITTAADTSNASGSVGSAVIGTANIIEQADTANATGTTAVVGTSATINNADTANASGWAGAVVGTAAILEQADTALAYGSTTGPTPTPIAQFGGGLSSSRNKRYYIERDGKRIFFTDVREVADLLEQEEEKVVAKAKQAIKKISKSDVAEIIEFGELDIPPPMIVMKFNDVSINNEIDRINQRINEHYQRALMQHMELMEEDEAFIALLFH